MRLEIASRSSGVFSGRLRSAGVRLGAACAATAVGAGLVVRRRRGFGVGASEPLAVAVVDFARQAGTDAAGELGTRADFDAGMMRLKVIYRAMLVQAAAIVGALVSIAGIVVGALRVLG